MLRTFPLSTVTSLIRVRGGVWPGGKKIPNFVFVVVFNHFMWWPAYADVVRSSRIWGRRISRERLDQTKMWAVVTDSKKPTNWGGMQNAAPLKFIPSRRRRHFRSFFRTSIYADLKISYPAWLCIGSAIGMDAHVKFGDPTLTGSNYSSRCRLVPFYALTCSIQLQFAADWK